MSRAFRRHHRKRIIKKFQRIYLNLGYENWEELGLFTASRGSISCGCWMCKNPRRNKFDNPLTMQEQKALDDANDQLNKKYKYINGCVIEPYYYLRRYK